MFRKLLKRVCLLGGFGYTWRKDTKVDDIIPIVGGFIHAFQKYIGSTHRNNSWLKKTHRNSVCTIWFYMINKSTCKVNVSNSVDLIELEPNDQGISILNHSHCRNIRYKSMTGGVMPQLLELREYTKMREWNGLALIW